MQTNIEKNITLVRIIESWATVENPMNSTEEIIKWINKKNGETTVQITKIPYDYSNTNDWHYDANEKGIVNQDKTFFQIVGLSMQDGNEIYEQPIILQNEIGYLGIIGKVIDGVLYFLMQAKIEPGNVNCVQISPTIQATKSNFMRAHGGNTPAYLEYFSNKHDYEIVVDQIQSEQSSRFMGKRNRNIIIVVDEEIEISSAHKWMTLGQIKQLMHYDNLVNMDTRTVLSCIPVALRDYSYKEITHIRNLFTRAELFNSLFLGANGTSINKIYQYINDVKMLDRRKIDIVDLFSLKTWELRKGEFVCKQKAEFKIIFCDIEIEGREVRRWRQPLLEALGQSVFGLIYCIDEDAIKFLVRAKFEVGCFDKIEIGPSVQMGPNDVLPKNNVEKLFNEKIQQGVEFEGIFSEEGGRFYHEQNKNVIVRIEKNQLPILPEGYFWADYQTLNILIQFNNCLNIQLRNLLSLLEI